MKQEEQPLVIESSINYKLSISTEGYEFSNEQSVGADLAGLCIAKRIHEDMMNEILKLKEIGIQKEFKQSFENRLKDLRKSIYTINFSINQVLKFVAKESVKEIEE